MQAKSKYVSQLEDCKMLNSRPNSSGPCLGNSANRSCGVWLKNWLPHVALLHSSVVMSLSTTRKVMSSNLSGGTFSNRRQSSKQRYTSQNSDKRAYFLPAFRAQNADIWRKSDRKIWESLCTWKVQWKNAVVALKCECNLKPGYARGGPSRLASSLLTSILMKFIVQLFPAESKNHI